MRPSKRLRSTASSNESHSSVKEIDSSADSLIEAHLVAFGLAAFLASPAFSLPQLPLRQHLLNPRQVLSNGYSHAIPSHQAHDLPMD